MQRRSIIMKVHNIKLTIFISLLLIGFVIFLIFIFKPYNYHKVYNVDDYKIFESYHKNDKYYLFEIKYADKVYPYLISNKYIHKRNLITNIETYTNENERCILPKSKEIDFYPLCSNEEEVYVYNLATKQELPFQLVKSEDKNKNYNNITIHDNNNLTYLLYNYRGFYLINDSEKDIKLFNKDVYSLDLVYQMDHYLVVADYNANYYFKKFYVIDINNGKVKEIESEEDISFNSVFLGDYKDKIYLLDKKEKKEYQINISKKQVLEVPLQILEKDKLVTKTYNEIVNNNLTFYKNDLYHYQILNNNLYININNYNVKLGNSKINKIIQIDNDIVYYLENGDLYKFSFKTGSILLLSNSEWNFNNTNMIFIFK